MITTTAGQRLAILRRAKTIAVVGASANPARASNFVLTYLLSSSADYEVWPVTPNETEILGVKCYPSLADIPTNVPIIPSAVWLGSGRLKWYPCP